MNISPNSKQENQNSDPIFASGIVPYAIAELFLAAVITVGNAIVMVAYLRYQDLRTTTNTYIFSLATTDFMAGLIGMPTQVYSAVTEEPKSFYACIFVHVLILSLCTISIFHLLAMALDKFVAITLTNQWHWNSKKKQRALLLITMSWLSGILIGFLPLMGWHKPEGGFEDRCNFLTVIDFRYLVYVIYFGTILTPTLIILYCYFCICRRIRQSAQTVHNLLNEAELLRRHRQRKSVIKSLLLIVLAFIVCWYPLYTINTVLYFRGNVVDPKWILGAVILSHLGSALNPLIYAVGMPGYRQALLHMFKISRSESGLPHIRTAVRSFTELNGLGRSHAKSRFFGSRGNHSTPVSPTIHINKCTRKQRSETFLSTLDPTTDQSYLSPSGKGRNYSSINVRGRTNSDEISSGPQMRPHTIRFRYGSCFESPVRNNKQTTANRYESNNTLTAGTDSYKSVTSLTPPIITFEAASPGQDQISRESSI